MILTGDQIVAAINSGDITIDPFEAANINPNSYNYHLGALIRSSDAPSFDAKIDAEWHDTVIPDGGMELSPHRIYLGSTRERIGSSKFVTTLLGRSTLGRLGLFVQVSADLGHLGPAHCWTLELHVVQPLRIYPGMGIGQICFWRPEGEKRMYRGPYVQHDDPVAPILGVLWN